MIFRKAKGHAPLPDKYLGFSSLSSLPLHSRPFSLSVAASTLQTQTYRQAAAAVRGFWYLLLGHHVSYRKLFRVFRDMETAENKADELFRSVLVKFPKSVKLLHLFSSYVEIIKKDPIRAQR